MYGLHRSGFDWMVHAEKVLGAHGWIAVSDFVNSCDSFLFYKKSTNGPLLICIHVDNLLASGHEETLRAALLEKI